MTQMTSHDRHFKAYKFIFQEKTVQLAFLVGVAFANNLLSGDQKSRWLNFMQSQILMVFVGNTLTNEEYDEIGRFLEEIDKFFRSEKGPTKEMIAQAEKACPQKGWLSPISLESWMFKQERR